MTIDGQGQPLNKGFGWYRNKDKALYGLKGMLRGYAADKELSELELLHLKDWLDSQETIKTDPDVIDLQDNINRILSDGHISQEELEDMLELIDCVIQYRLLDNPDVTGEMNKLLGILEGVTSDGVVNTQEVAKIQSWIDRNASLIDAWPVRKLKESLDEFSANSSSNEGLAKLTEIIQKITGVDFVSTGASGGASHYHVDSGHRIEFEGRRFVLTGHFKADPRSEFAARICDRGGLVGDGVTKKTDYLVIGSFGSRDWKHSSYGLKYDKAVSLQEKGCPIVFVSEDDVEKQLLIL